MKLIGKTKTKTKIRDRERNGNERDERFNGVQDFDAWIQRSKNYK